MANEFSGMGWDDLFDAQGNLLGGSNSLSRKILESAANGFTISDMRLPDAPLIYANPAFLRTTGYTLEEVVGRNCRFLQGPDRNQPALVGLREALRGGYEVTTLLRNYRKDGIAFWNELFLSPVRDHDGNLTHFFGVQHDVTVRVDMEHRLAQLAHYDALTGLPNRTLLMDRLRQATLRASRTGRYIAVLFFDLDNFKTVNDMFGHDAGDALLKVVAQRLQSSKRSYETAARLAGDEFIVVLDDLQTLQDAEDIKQRLIREVSLPTTVMDQVFHPSASVGMACYPHDGTTPEELIRAADTAMYVVKHTRNDEPPSSRQASAVEVPLPSTIRKGR